MQKNKKAQKKNKKQRRVSPNSNGNALGNGVATHIHLGPNTVNWMRALSNPESAPLAGVPVAPVQRARSLRVFAKGTLKTGDTSTSSTGFVAMNPEGGVSNDSATASGGFVRASDLGTFAGSTIGLAGTGVSGFNSNSDYTSAQVGTGNTQFEYRVVAAKLRVRYTGTELNRGGEIVGLLDPNHFSLQGRSQASLLTDIDAVKLPVVQKWATLRWKPFSSQSRNDAVYNSALPTYTPAATDTSFYMGIMLTAPSVATQLTFEWEAYAVYQAYGPLIRGVECVPADILGYNAVSSALLTSGMHKLTHDPDAQVTKNLLAHTARHIADHSSFIQKIPMSHVALLKDSSKNSSWFHDFLDDLGNMFGIGSFLTDLFL